MAVSMTTCERVQARTGVRVQVQVLLITVGVTVGPLGIEATVGTRTIGATIVKMVAAVVETMDAVRRLASARDGGRREASDGQ